jgi:uncharacterized protein (UPF0147 family)
MATTLYFHAASNGLANLPTDEQSTLTPDANKSDAVTVNRSMNPTVGASPVFLGITSTADTGAHNYYFGRFVSEPLVSVTSISANTWTYKFAASSANASGNFPCSSTNKAVNVTCYVWRPGTGKLGNILDGASAATVDEGTAGVQTYHIVSFTGSAVNSVQNGDVIVFEVWFQITQAAATGYVDRWFYDGTTDSAENATVTTPASCIITPQTLTFGTNIAQTFTHLYNIKTLIAQTYTHLYNIKNLIVQSYTHPYNIRQLATQTYTHLYNLRQLATQSYTHLYSIKNLIAQTYTHPYNIKNLIAQTYTHVYNILTSATQVMQSFTHIYNLRQLATQSYTHLYNLKTLIAQTYQHLYNIKNLVTQSYTHPYNIRNLIAQTYQHLYSIKNLILQSYTHPYNIKNLVAQTYTHIYNLLGILQASQTFTHIYNIRELTSQTFTHKYNILNLIAQTFTHLYDILALGISVTATFTHIYNIKNLATQLYTHVYNILGSALPSAVRRVYRRMKRYANGFVERRGGGSPMRFSGKNVVKPTRPTGPTPPS